MFPGRIFEPLAGHSKTLHFLKALPFNHFDAFHRKVLKFSVMSRETILVSQEITKQNQPNAHTHT